VVDGLYVKALTNRASSGADRQPVVGRAHHQGRLIHSGISVDQMIANHVGQTRNLPSCWLASSP
jgi:hypothetical protein